MWFIFVWYIYLSMIDWTIHRYILHSGIETKIRQEHRIHHLAHEGKIYTDIGLTFSIYEGLVIAGVSILPVLLIAKLTNFTILTAGLLHICFVLAGVGIHNYAHGRCHQRTAAGVFKLPLPSMICNVLQKHHEKHHSNPNTNFCTTFIGFDILAMTGN